MRLRTSVFPGNAEIHKGGEEKGAYMNDRIIIDPATQHGKPVIRGTRVPVVRILGGLAGGMTIEEITQEYNVTEADIRAALAYASEIIDQEEHHLLPAE